MHAPLIHEFRDVLGRVRDGVLTVEDIEHVSTLHGQHKTPGHVATNFVLQLVGAVLKTIDFSTGDGNPFVVGFCHGFDEWSNLARTSHRSPHVFLHGPDGRSSDKLVDPGHGRLLRSQ